jgi:hypothetical protein
MRGIALVAEQAHRLAGFDQRHKLFHRLDRFGRLEMLVVDTPKRFEIALARGFASLGRRTQFLQVDIGDAVLVEPGRELVLGKTGTPRGCNRAGVDQDLDLGAGEFAQHRSRGRLFVADSE